MATRALLRQDSAQLLTVSLEALAKLRGKAEGLGKTQWSWTRCKLNASRKSDVGASQDLNSASICLQHELAAFMVPVLRAGLKFCSQSTIKKHSETTCQDQTEASQERMHVGVIEAEEVQSQKSSRHRRSVLES